MSREQAAPKRGATERAQRRRRNAPASLCCFAGTGAQPAPRQAGMRPQRMASRADRTAMETATKSTEAHA